MIRFRSYRAKLQAAFLILGLAAILITGWESSIGAASALRQATYDRLIAIRETKSRQIERYFQDAANHVLALSADESTVEAVELFREAWTRVPVIDRETGRLEQFYAEAGIAREWMPADARSRALQSHFTLAAGARDMLLAVPQLGRYSDVHARFHPTLHRYQSAFGFYDIFLLDARDGRVLYTVLKEVDLGVRLTSAPYNQTSLARAFSGAMALTEPERFVIEDYAPYVASQFAPAAFLASPVWRAGNKIGVLAIQISVDEVNRVMTGDRQWIREGLGRTGQSYIVGPDNTLRSDFRFEIEEPDAFYRQLLDSGTDPAIVEKIRRNRTAILNLELRPQVGAAIRNGVRGVESGVDLRGVEVLRSHAPLATPGLDWILIAEIEAAEALAPVSALRQRIAGVGLLVSVLFFVVASLLARSVTKPVLALAANARKLGVRDFGDRIQVDSSDEIGELAVSFNRMADDLEKTTVSKEELDRTLSALINAVFVVSAPAGASVDEVLASPIRRGNPAACALLRTDSLQDRAFGEFVPMAGPWRDLLQRLLSEGRLPAVQVELQPSSGERVPVLFTAAVLSGEPGGILCAAQDIADWKAAQDELRRMSKVFMDAADPIVVCDLDGRVTDANGEAERVYDWRRDELRGKPLVALAPRNSGVLWQNLLGRCLQGESIRNVEAVQVNRQGKRIPVLVTLSKLAEGGVAVIAKDISDRKEAERALRQKQQELEALTARLITAQEEERSRLARELHDDLTQRLAVVAIEAGSLERDPGLDPERRRRLQRVKEQMARLSDDVHDLSRRLHPSILDDLGLIAAIESETRGYFERGGAPVELSHAGRFDSLPKGVQLALFRIVQEALRNIQKHSNADEVRVQLTRSGSSVELRIEDNGEGFDRARPDWRPGLGLASMEERARLLGGVLRVESKPGSGTRIEALLPFGDWDEEAKSLAG